MERYTIQNFQSEFPDEEACLEWLKDRRWPDGIPCEKCGEVTKHHLMKNRRSYSCQECGHHVHPTAGTIFENTRTDLTLWFYAIYLMAQTRGGISAKQVEREIGVTYKTAWRMCKLIRSKLYPDDEKVDGEVEVDETYMGGSRSGGKRGRGAEGKDPVAGLAEREGDVRVKVVDNVKAATLIPFVTRHVKPGATVYTDELYSYNRLPEKGYRHRRIRHSDGVYVQGDVHTNTVEGFWSNTKRGISGVYHHVSAKYLQSYLDEYAFRYNHRKSQTPMFRLFLRRMALPLAR